MVRNLQQHTIGKNNSPSNPSGAALVAVDNQRRLENWEKRKNQKQIQQDRI
jgi:hypothetical protein